uniref:Uncharacterized protein n=1 Tax=Arundo donax TaxID=35708 RepID=A0A0A9C6H4_ARUDO
MSSCFNISVTSTSAVHSLHDDDTTSSPALGSSMMGKRTRLLRMLCRDRKKQRSHPRRFHVQKRCKRSTTEVFPIECSLGWFLAGQRTILGSLEHSGMVLGRLKNLSSPDSGEV